MSEFFRFPHTPHLAWLGEGEPRDDKLLDPPEVEALLADEVLVEEKLDGANLGISWGDEGQLRVQNRGAYLEPPYRGQFSRLNQWLMQHLAVFQQHLPDHVILFGEWCAARHSLDYAALPDWFLIFDIYDRQAQRFWNHDRRNDLASRLGLSVVPLLKRGFFTVNELEALVHSGRSAYRDGKLEGLVIRQDGPKWCEHRAKLVHPNFVQQIEEHWRSRALEWNELAAHQ
ncbi:RNA ligase family protein [Halomonas sp. MCCC 1A11062]|uniref:RNA ligase family protein n=1 Tax=Halomonas sp. MCCC 1A11062 TaxID=2733485 RepID=UPI001F47B6EF|nr:RNA ligase family protein [Halomonas sp. MCCC 1A11062]MCE8037031.1 RNA ligase family protein [Halomonas sp. MCCC 1A11062]